MKQRTIFSSLALALAAALAGCAATTPTAAPDAPATASQEAAQGHEAQIRQRSEAFWEARRRNDVAAAYALTSPSYRKVHDQEFFRVHYAGLPVVATREIVDVQCDETQHRCILRDKYMVTTPLTAGALVPVFNKEIWLHEDGQWWIFRD